MIAESLRWAVLTLICGPALADPVLTVTVDGAETNQGQIILSLFDSEDSFLKQPARSLSADVGTAGAVEFSIEDLAPGSYAISVIHDADGNGELNTGFLGIPSELVGFSNNAKGFMGPPSYQAAEFRFDQSLQLSINLGKAKD